MRKALAFIFITNVFLVLALLAFFGLYGQFMLDYSLENLKSALQDSRFWRPAIESLAWEEMSRTNGDLQTAILLDDALRSLNQSTEKQASERAEVFIREALRKKTQERAPLLRITDTFYHLGKFLQSRVAPKPVLARGKISSAVSRLLLSEAEHKERKGRLEEAERYYQEFLKRFPEHSERGFVQLALAGVLLKKVQTDEAIELLKNIQKNYEGEREAAQARSLLRRAESAKVRMADLVTIEDRLRNRPELLFTEEGGLELALAYLATYQLDRANSLFEKLAEAPDPRLRTKAFFYRDWVRQWQSQSGVAAPV